jgi:hypothetical protein
MTVIWDVAPCGLIKIFRCKLNALIMEAVSTSETSDSFNQTTRRNTPADSHLHLSRLNMSSITDMSEELESGHAQLTTAARVRSCPRLMTGLIF